MARYQVQFISSGIVAFSASERGIAEHWFSCNNFEPEEQEIDPHTGECTGKWIRGKCLNLFKIVRLK